jgi:hypothetical protein
MPSLRRTAASPKLGASASPSRRARWRGGRGPARGRPVGAAPQLPLLVPSVLWALSVQAVCAAAGTRQTRVPSMCACFLKRNSRSSELWFQQQSSADRGREAVGTGIDRSTVRVNRGTAVRLLTAGAPPNPRLRCRNCVTAWAEKISNLNTTAVMVSDGALVTCFPSPISAFTCGFGNRYVTN